MKEVNGKILLEEGKTYALPIKNGHLDIRVSVDPDYPGLDIEYISDKENTIADDELVTRPRVLIEQNTEFGENVNGGLRALVWGNPHSEDYSESVEFTCIEDLEK